MPPKRKKTKSSEHPKQREIKKCIFTVAKDVILLKEAIQQNPWQLGKDKWSAITAEMKKQLEFDVSQRTIKERISLLLKKYTAQQIISKTGTEEQQSERAHLLEELMSIVEEADSFINQEIGAEDVELNDDCFTDITNAEAENSSNAPNFDLLGLSGELMSKVPISKQLDRKREKIEADKERDEICAKMNLCESASETLGIRKKRLKLSAEDELIKIKQEHEIKMQNSKLEMEEINQTRSYELEQRKLLLEEARIAVEEKREQRLAEENKRRDDISASQLKFQSQMFEFMMQLTKDS